MLVETIVASLGCAVHRAELIADLESAFTTTLAALTSTVEAKDDYTSAHGEDVAGLAERVALRMGLAGTRGARRALRGDAARHRQDRRAQRDPAEARAADRRGVGDDAQPRRGRRRAGRAGSMPSRTSRRR